MKVVVLKSLLSPSDRREKNKTKNKNVSGQTEQSERRKTRKKTTGQE